MPWSAPAAIVSALTSGQTPVTVWLTWFESLISKQTMLARLFRLNPWLVFLMLQG